METFKLDTTPRSTSGKGVARKLRAEGLIPAVLYGHKEDVVGISVNEADLRAILVAHPESALVDLDFGSAKKKSTVNAIVRDVQRHPATGRVLHVDFQRISLDEKVRMEVHVELQGNPVGVKEQGGVLEHGTRSLTIMCLPTQIPEAIVVDVSELSINDHARLSEVMGRYPDVEFVDDPETWIATVVPPTIEVVEEPEEEGVEGEEAPAEDEAAEEKAESEEDTE